jgi:hypothetical protein
VFSFIDDVGPPFKAIPTSEASVVTVLAGFMYQLVYGEKADARPCGTVRGVWDHPN